MEALKELKALKTVDLSHCKELSPEAVDRLRGALPRAYLIVTGTIQALSPDRSKKPLTLDYPITSTGRNRAHRRAMPQTKKTTRHFAAL
jgi:hypothetical protein